MSISGRKQIKWEHGEWEETTSTLTLVSRQRKYYTDIRIADKHIPPRAGLPQCLPSPPSPVATTPPTLSGTGPELAWAFAGTLESKQRKDSDGNRKTTTRWQHWIDSIFKKEEEVTDVGTSQEYGERGENLHIEKGQCANPDTGLVQPFEEIWLEFPVDSIKAQSNGTPGSSSGTRSNSGSQSISEHDASSLSNGRGQTPSKNKVCIVLQAEDKPFDIRGLVIRVGGWCQGVFIKGTETSAERWCWTHHENAHMDNWEQVFKTGTGSVPCRSLWEKEDMELGDEIQSGGMKWKVVEKEIWS